MFGLLSKSSKILNYWLLNFRGFFWNYWKFLKIVCEGLVKNLCLVFVRYFNFFPPVWTYRVWWKLLSLLNDHRRKVWFWALLVSLVYNEVRRGLCVIPVAANNGYCYGFVLAHVSIVASIILWEVVDGRYSPKNRVCVVGTRHSCT